MKGTKRREQTAIGKFPYGIISGACAMFVFFATFGLIVAYVVLSGIAEQTSDTVSFFENSWQVALFVFDIIFLVAAIGALVMFILKAIGLFDKPASLNGQLLQEETAVSEAGQNCGITGEI